MFEDVILEQEQKDLLHTLVEAHRANREHPFLVASSRDGTSIVHDALPSGGIPASAGDVRALANAGMLSIVPLARGLVFYMSPLGVRYSGHLKAAAERPIQQIEEDIRTYLDSERFQHDYPAPFGKWVSAAEMLWESDAEEELTRIGHACREAMQLFATTLVDRYQPPNVDTDKAHTVSRMKSVLNHRAARLGTTEKLFLETLLRYWVAVDKLVQRQEHGAQRERESLSWEDARRVVFQTALVMYEIDRALSRGS